MDAQPNKRKKNNRKTFFFSFLHPRSNKAIIKMLKIPLQTFEQTKKSPLQWKMSRPKSI